MKYTQNYKLVSPKNLWVCFNIDFCLFKEVWLKDIKTSKTSLSFCQIQFLSLHFLLGKKWRGKIIAGGQILGNISIITVTSLMVPKRKEVIGWYFILHAYKLRRLWVSVCLCFFRVPIFNYNLILLHITVHFPFLHPTRLMSDTLSSSVVEKLISQQNSKHSSRATVCPSLV